MSDRVLGRACADCGEPHNTGYEAMACFVCVLRAENRRMRDALLALDGTTVVGTAAKPGIGHAAFWAIVRHGLGEPYSDA